MYVCVGIYVCMSIRHYVFSAMLLPKPVSIKSLESVLHLIGIHTTSLGVSREIVQ